MKIDPFNIILNIHARTHRLVKSFTLTIKFNVGNIIFNKNCNILKINLLSNYNI